jgi:hypothetical protein
MAAPRERAKAWTERMWITLFIVLGFLFAVWAPPVMAVPLSLIASALGVLDGYVHRRLLGWQWVAAPAIYGILWIAFIVLPVFREG